MLLKGISCLCFGLLSMALLTRAGEPPRLENPIDGERTAFVNDTIRLTCKFQKPMPYINWYYQGKPVRNPERVRMNRYGTLIITGVRLSDAGSYRCKGTNGYGSTWADFTLKVTERPVEIFTPEVENPTCLEGSNTCHSTAQCVDYDDGFCCKCIPPNYGNGIQCITPDQPQRLNGKVSGSLNGINFEDLHMNAFVATKDGRAYVAISRVPAEVGSYILTLNTIGGVVGWLFAIQEGDQAMNGYTYTGGKFTRVVQIRYRAGGEVNISQTFFGNDVLGNIRMKTRIDGTLPDMDGSLVSITVDDYQEEYQRVAPGIIKSFSEQTYRIDSEEYKYTWNQTITFDECMADPGLGREDTMRLSVSENLVSIDSNVIRFAMTNKIAVHTGFDPCQEDINTCHENADCTPSGDTITCSCRTGFVGDGYNCEAQDSAQPTTEQPEDSTRNLDKASKYQAEEKLNEARQKIEEIKEKMKELEEIID